MSQQEGVFFAQLEAGIVLRDSYHPIGQYIGGGYYFEKGIGLLLHLGHTSSNFLRPQNTQNVHVFCGTIESFIRPLTAKKLSPLIGISLDIPIYSNAKGKFVSQEDYTIVSPHPLNFEAPSVYNSDIFNDALESMKLKLMLDRKFTNASVCFGPTLNFDKIQATNLTINVDQNGYPWVLQRNLVQRKFIGLGMEIQFRYYFN